MLQKLFFLVSLLGVNHAGWYTNGNGFTIGLVIAAVISLIAGILFYYVWGKLKSVTRDRIFVPSTVFVAIAKTTNTFLFFKVFFRF